MKPRACIPQRQRDGEELLGLISLAVQRSLTRFGVAGHLAAPVSADITAGMRSALGGREVYIPKGRPDAAGKAAKAFERAAAGERVSVIAKDMRCSRSYVYALIGMERRRRETNQAARATATAESRS